MNDLTERHRRDRRPHGAGELYEKDDKGALYGGEGVIFDYGVVTRPDRSGCWTKPRRPIPLLHDKVRLRPHGRCTHLGWMDARHGGRLTALCIR